MPKSISSMQAKWNRLDGSRILFCWAASPHFVGKNSREDGRFQSCVASVEAGDKDFEKTSLFVQRKRSSLSFR
jgi:hypothetical protein